MNLFWFYLVQFLVFSNLLSAQINPNHVAINEKRKHIEVDSSWLDKKQQEVQRVQKIGDKGGIATFDGHNTNKPIDRFCTKTLVYNYKLLYYY
uniref:Uncharacterized protein n=1 Tax=Heterorhabditis bacteriophora TaxID=37862 RepID=A0A1I7WE40_HETBA